MFGGNGAFFGENGACAGFCAAEHACLTICTSTGTNIARCFTTGITAQLGKIGFGRFGALVIDAKLPCGALFATADTDASLGSAAAFGTCCFELVRIDLFRTGFGL